MEKNLCELAGEHSLCLNLFSDLLSVFSPESGGGVFQCIVRQTIEEEESGKHGRLELVPKKMYY